MIDETLSRRNLIRLVGLGVVTLRAGLEAQAPSIEQQRGDPDSPYETLRYDGEAVRSLVLGGQKAQFADWKADVPGRLVDVAARYVGYSRENNRDGIAEFLSLFGLPFADAAGPVFFARRDWRLWLLSHTRVR